MTWFDLIVLGIMGLSVLFAGLRGFTREMITLLALAVGLVAAYYLAPGLTGLAGADSALAAFLIFFFLFAAGFVGSVILLGFVAEKVIAEKPGRIDRALGVLFGFLRGYLLIGLGFLAIDYYFEAGSKPSAIENALTRDFAASAGAVLEGMGLESVTTTADSMDLALAIPFSVPFPVKTEIMS